MGTVWANYRRLHTGRCCRWYEQHGAELPPVTSFVLLWDLCSLLVSSPELAHLRTRTIYFALYKCTHYYYYLENNVSGFDNTRVQFLKVSRLENKAWLNGKIMENIHIFENRLCTAWHCAAHGRRHHGSCWGGDNISHRIYNGEGDMSGQR